MIFRVWLRALNGSLLVIALAAPIGAGEIEVPFEPLEPSSPEVKRLISIAGAEGVEKALAAAQKLTSKQPDNLEAWMFLGLMQADNGEYEQALAAFEKGVRKTDADLPFLLMMARVHEDRGRLGPGGARIGGGVRYTKVPDDIDEKAFKSGQFRAAAKCFEGALEIRPGMKPYQAKRAALLLAAGDAQAAYEATKDYVKTNPEESVLWRQQAMAAEKLGLWSEARAAAEHCLALNNHDAGACLVMAGVFRNEGSAADADTWLGRAVFYANIPDFFAVPYSEKTDALIRPVLDAGGVNITIGGDDEGDNAETKEPDDQREKKRREAIAAIDNLIALKSDISSQLLGAIALSHSWHGEVENRIYAELEARKDEALLVLLLGKAQSACTVGGCAPALARLKSDAAFPLIVELLPNDRGMFSMRIPEALAIYGRPESAAIIASALQESLNRLKSSGISPETLMSGFGERIFARRCIWALEDFKNPEAQDALAKAAREDDFKADALAVLFYQTRKNAWFKQLIAHLKRNPREAERMAEYFRKAGLPNAAEIEKIAEAAKKQDQSKKSDKTKRPEKNQENARELRE